MADDSADAGLTAFPISYFDILISYPHILMFLSRYLCPDLRYPQRREGAQALKPGITQRNLTPAPTAGFPVVCNASCLCPHLLLPCARTLATGL